MKISRINIPCMKMKILPLRWFFFALETFMENWAVHNFIHEILIGLRGWKWWNGHAFRIIMFKALDSSCLLWPMHDVCLVLIVYWPITTVVCCECSHDDFGGAHLLYEESGCALSALQSVFRWVGLDESVEKTWQPTMIMPWLGVLVNSWDMTLSIPEEKLDEVLQ